MEEKIQDFPKLEGFKKVVIETSRFDNIVKGAYLNAANEVYGSAKTPGLAAFAYGSPGRIELIGGDSDADIFLVERHKTERSKNFRKLLKDKLKFFDFSKIDVPDWGTIKEISIYLRKSLVEGNQVLETRFLVGDSKIDSEIKKMKDEYNTIERSIINIYFNRLYFNQYFRQKLKNGSPNIKYCNGGSRDLLFVDWYDDLCRRQKGEKEDDAYCPRIWIALTRLLKGDYINEKEFEESIEAINFLINLRSDVLILNKNTEERGLTFLDEVTLNRLESIGYTPSKITKKRFEGCRKTIDNLVNNVLNLTIDTAESKRSLGWGSDFRKAYNINTPVQERRYISPEDPLMRIALIWGSSESCQEELFRYLTNRYKYTSDWATIGSIVCSPLCESNLLHYFGTGIAKEKGYGYLLRVIARHKNVSEDTLRSIVNDPSLEERYTQIARVALYGGQIRANRQI